MNFPWPWPTWSLVKLQKLQQVLQKKKRKEILATTYSVSYREDLLSYINMQQSMCTVN